MGSNDDPVTKAIDASVGGLVWVRRRNGSWWPGQILSLHEVPESSLVSPKAGTPVKLLGRDDASVDWYNLEKSKRVKAFRCGEYDGCIEKAKVAAANSSKKTVKYARREDAIIHALDIESTCLVKDLTSCHRTTDSSCNELPTTRVREGSKHMNGDATLEEGLDTAQELSQSGITFEEPNNISFSRIEMSQWKRSNTPNDSEDDTTEGSKRMRGLDDLGMDLSSRLKAEKAGNLDKLTQENDFLDSLNGNGKPNACLVNRNKGFASSLKRKRSQTADVHELLKRKNRRRQLAKVLKSTRMVPVPIICDQLASSNASPHQAATESKASGTESTLANNSDSSGASAENGVSLIDLRVHKKVKNGEISVLSGLADNDPSDKLFDVPFVGDEKQPAGFLSIFVQNTEAEGEELRNEVSKGPVSTNTSVLCLNDNSQGFEKNSSKWQLKRKRNSRPTSKCRRQDSKRIAMKELINGYLASGESFSRSPLVSGNLEHNINARSEFFCGDVLQSGRSKTEEKLLPVDSLPMRRLPSSRPSRYAVQSRCHISDLHGRNSSLYDVKVEVNAGYRRQHVPLVSLMSKLNGKAVVGHPVTIDVVEDGFCDQLLSSADCLAPTIKASRVPTTIRKTSESRKKRKKKLKSKSRRSKKLKLSSSTSKKIRRLSTLTGRKLSEEDKKEMAEKPREAVVACIPLKLVFSRINEALNGSMRTSHRP